MIIHILIIPKYRTYKSGLLPFLCYDKEMKLTDLGFHKELESFLSDGTLDAFRIGRVTSEHKNRYIVRSEDGEYDAEVLGKLMHEADDRAGYPAVGDWVSFSPHDDARATIHSILPRSSVLARKAARSYAEQQVIATNIDVALIVQAVGRDFSINRIERYLIICRASRINPVIVISKADLVSPELLAKLIDDINVRIKNVPIVTVSNDPTLGFKNVKAIIEPGKTYCLLGSSGVGKSTLINYLAGEAVMETGKVGAGTKRGKHVTSHRELVLLEGGGIMIDNPGMREVGIGDVGEVLDEAYGEIMALYAQCQFNDCKHINEKGCAVLKAIDDGTLNQASYENYTRMRREAEHYRLRVADKREKGHGWTSAIKKHKKR